MRSALIGQCTRESFHNLYGSRGPAPYFMPSSPSLVGLGGDGQPDAGLPVAMGSVIVDLSRVPSFRIKLILGGASSMKSVVILKGAAPEVLRKVSMRTRRQISAMPGRLWYCVRWVQRSESISSQETFKQNNYEGTLGPRLAGFLQTNSGYAWRKCSVAVSVAFWTFACPAFWQLNHMGYSLTVAVWFLVVFGILAMRNVATDQTTYKVWCCWLTVLCLPLCKKYTILVKI